MVKGAPVQSHRRRLVTARSHTKRARRVLALEAAPRRGAAQACVAIERGVGRPVRPRAARGGGSIPSHHHHRHYLAAAACTDLMRVYHATPSSTVARPATMAAIRSGGVGLGNM
jgi:hypothetical protein